ncbi:hypothetical protein BASA50_006869 [Batrachochytrium salamandrivorans]|uniref:Conserved oligomeric Golgi complex subunit 7 n=1 Tax=Batrachochytrium salamandrivorans TaxID=1357716 RepID=A0ABQ8F8R7_9FUNG|nr:hypothetical protein BASA62_008115 [Batrachochytrium salamandrivorans]KAH6594172.1 hypothetical protein BASA50_006869 [Batrachochytrium salamandrivorans]
MHGLLEPDFDVKHWINKALAEKTGSRADVSERVKALVTDLQLQIQMTTERLDKLASEVVVGVPRTLQDLEAVQRDTTNLADSLDEVGGRNSMSHSSSTTDNVDAAFAKLSHMDTALVNMESTRLCLKEAENWNSLTAEMDAIFVSQDYDKAAARLMEAKRSLTLLTGSASFEERQTLLSKLSDQLLDSLRVQLTAALASKNSDVVERLGAVYIHLDAADVFHRLYSQAHCAPLLQLWTSTCTMPNKIDALQSFYEQTMTVVSQDLSSANSDLASSTLHMANGLLDFLFHSMTPRLVAWIRQIHDTLASQGEMALYTIVQLYTLSCRFVQGMHVRLQQIVEADLDASLASPPIVPWAAAILDCFVPYQQDYRKLERHHLMLLLPKNSVVDNSSSISAFFVECNSRVFFHCEAAIKRCDKLTFGLGLFVAAEAIDSYIVGVANLTVQILQYLGAAPNTDALVAAGSAAATGVGSGLSSENTEESRVNTGLGSIGDSNDGPYMQDEEWSDFRSVVAIHNTVVSLTTRHQALTVLLQAAMEKSASPSATGEHHNASVARAYLKEMISQGRIDYADPQIQVEGKTDAQNEAEEGSLDTSQPPLHIGRSALTSAAIESQKLVFGCLLLRITRDLDEMPAMACWAAPSTDSASPFDLKLPEFSLLPLSYMTRIGEQLLALPLHMDVFSGEQSLQFSLTTLPGLKPSDLELDPSEPVDVTHIWILSISRAIELMFLSKIQCISVLSMHGCRQLVTDINYLSNVFSAMEIETHASLGEMVHFLECSEAELAASISKAEADDAIENKIMKHIALQRGLFPKDMTGRLPQ